MLVSSARRPDEHRAEVPVLHVLQRPIALILLPLFLLETTGCTSVHRVAAVDTAPPTEERLVGITTVAAQDIDFDGNGEIRADTVYAKVHGKPIQVPVDSVQRWWIRRASPGKSVAAGIGVVLGITLLIGAIAVATKESCPFVYAWDGERYVFDAEPYGGAITRGLERDDYSLLPRLRPDGGQYRLLVTNEVNETQMTNLFELWAVDHAPGVRIVPDEWGGLHTISGALPPTRVVDQTGRDLRAWVASDDRLIWEQLPIRDSAGSIRDEVTLTFPKPAGATQAKLVARVGTALWGSHMIRALLQLRGESLEAWYARMDSSPAAVDSVRGWAVQEELYGLQVKVQEPHGWEVRGILGGSGPFLAEERVIPLDISAVEGNELTIRLRPPRGFWALNYFAIDYTPDQAVAVDTLHPLTASGNTTADILAALTSADTLYYEMPNTGDRALLTFPTSPPRPGLTRSVVLHSRGYYHLHLNPAGKPDTTLARRVEQVPDAAAEYSASLYRYWPMARRQPF